MIEAKFDHLQDKGVNVRIKGIRSHILTEATFIIASLIKLMLEKLPEDIPEELKFQAIRFSIELLLKSDTEEITIDFDELRGQS